MLRLFLTYTHSTVPRIIIFYPDKTIYLPQDTEVPLLPFLFNIIYGCDNICMGTLRQADKWQADDLKRQTSCLAIHYDFKIKLENYTNKNIISDCFYQAQPQLQV